MSKKIIAVVLAAIVAVIGFVFVGCNKDGGETTTAPSDSSSASGEANADWDAIKESGNLVVGITEYEPMDFQDENGEWTGFDAEYAKAVAEKLGLTVKFVEVDWDNKEMELSSKKVDCLWNGLTITDDRKANMSISEPYLGNKQVMVTSKDNVEKYGSDITDARVVAETGSAGEELATANDFFRGAKYTGVDSQAKALMEVKSGTADIAVVDYVTSIGSIGEGTDYADLAVVEAQEFEPEEYGIAFRKGSDITEKVNGIMKELAADGTLKKIAEKYKLQDLLLVK